MERTLLRLNKDDIRKLHGKIQLGRVKAGQTIVREGAGTFGLFIVREGNVLVQRNLNSYVVTVATLGKDDMFGESAFISPEPRPASASVVAADDTDLLVLTPKRLQPLFDEDPGLFARFFESIALMLSRRLRAYNEQTTGTTRDRFGDLPDWEIL